MFTAEENRNSHLQP